MSHFDSFAFKLIQRTTNHLLLLLLHFISFLQQKNVYRFIETLHFSSPQLHCQNSLFHPLLHLPSSTPEMPPFYSPSSTTALQSWSQSHSIVVNMLIETTDVRLKPLHYKKILAKITDSLAKRLTECGFETKNNEFFRRK